MTNLPLIQLHGKKFSQMSIRGLLKRQLGVAAMKPHVLTRKPQKHIPMEYMLIMTETAADFAKRNDPNQAPAYFGAWAAYVKAIAESGIMVSGLGLQPPETATTVRIRDGKRVLHDGPYAEAKEMLGGFFVINVPDLDAALEWAARSPSAESGCVEVRPALPPMNH
jgi:hypothetical protein